MVDFQCKSRYDWADFLQVMALLRAPGGCPWDAQQTHDSIRRNFLEETYEALDALDRDDPQAMCEELGDVLMQAAFHAQIEAERGRFTMDDVVDGVTKKLIYRHPHVFGTVQADTSEEVLVNWEILKRREKGQRSTADAVESVPHTLPALWRAEKIQKKAAKVGFDWPDIDGALSKVQEELQEVHEAQAGRGDPQEELGDLLFACVNVARFLKVDPEVCLQKSCDKFIKRFAAMEELADKEGRQLEDMTLQEMDRLWERAKEIDR